MSKHLLHKSLRFSLILLGALALTMQASLGQDRPVVDFFEPVKGSLEQQIKVWGSNFPPTVAETAVKFGAVEGEVATVADSVITVKVPAGALFERITVINKSNGLQATSRRRFLPSFSGAAFNAEAFSTYQTFESPNGLYNVFMADLDPGQNGLAEVISVNDLGTTIEIFKNNSTDNALAFELALEQTGLTNGSIHLRVVDLDGDGRLDLLVAPPANSAGRLFYFRNTTSVAGSYGFIRGYLEVEDNYDLRDIQAVDLNEDGRPELILSARFKPEIKIIKNLSAPGSIIFDAPANAIDLPLPDVNGGYMPVADLNQDGLMDIVVNGFNAGLYVIKNESVNGEIFFSDAQTIQEDGTFLHVELGDLDSDGLQEIVVTDNISDSLMIFPNKSSSSVSYGSPVGIYSDNDPWASALADMDGDGKLDIVLSSTDKKRLKLLRNTTAAAGNFAFEGYDIDLPVNALFVTLGDLNGDAKPEILFPQTDNTLGERKFGVIFNESCYRPHIADGPTVNICQDESYTLQATHGRGITYTWERTFGGTTTTVGSDAAEYTVLNEEGVYRVQMENADGSCSEWSNSVEVNLAGIGPSDEPDWTGENMVCYGDDLILSSTNDAGFTFNWELPDGTTSSEQTLVIENVTFDDQGVYRLSISDGGCFSAPVEIPVTISSPPALNIAYEGTGVFCESGSLEMTVREIDGFSYQWFKDGTAIDGATQFTYTASEDGEYSVETTDERGCTRFSTAVPLKVYGAITAAFSGPDVVCLGDEVTFMNESVSASSDSLIYQWYVGTELMSTEKNPSITFSEPGDYSVRLSVSYEGDACEQISEQQLKVADNRSPLISFEIFGQGCMGDSVRLSVPDNYTSYQWSTGETTPEIMVKESGDFSVILVAEGLCTIETDTSVLFGVVPEFEVTASLDTINPGGKTTLRADGNAASYQWEPASSLSNPTIAAPLATPQETTTYTVTGFSEEGCAVSKEITVFVRSGVDFTPKPAKVLTPNNDGINDTWKVENIERYPDNVVKIFDRFGRLIFEKNNYRNSFDGTNNGEPLEEDAYYYIIQYDNGKVLKGSFVLVR